MLIYDILNKVQQGTIEIADAAKQLRTCFCEDIGDSCVDHDRKYRTGASEVIFGEEKTAQQIITISESILRQQHNVLITRIKEDMAQLIMAKFPQAEHSALARAITIYKQRPATTKDGIIIVSAGTSDSSVMEEAKITAEFYGNQIITICDIGIAGLHRLLTKLPILRQAKVIIAIAGMEGALPSVLAGLVSVPVIAVPTSIGYGSSLGGLTTMLAMLNSCSAGVSVVNIDNGFGAAYVANLINRQYQTS